MKKQAVIRGLLGIPLGISLGYIITILISLTQGGGGYVSCAPSLIEVMGTEVSAVILQTVLCGILGAAFGACSVIWELDSWSLAKQTGVYFFITAVVMLPVAYLNHWMEHSLKGVLGYFGIFLGIFIMMWISMYLVYRKRVKQLNAKLEN